VISDKELRARYEATLPLENPPEDDPEYSNPESGMGAGEAEVCEECGCDDQECHLCDDCGGCECCCECGD